MGDGNILEEKWRKFLRFRPIFSLIPFLDFVIVAGSLALGNVHKDSDFDVIVGARQGRIFTVRAFCVFIFGLLGLRRRGIDHKIASSNKVCFSHFVTPKAYRLSPPYNDYWRVLYEHVVPVYGREKAAREFFRANSWAPRDKIFNEKYWNPAGGILKYTTWIFEWFLGEFLGDGFEKFVKKIQMRRIEKSLGRDVGFKPRLKCNDNELEFHLDTRRIEEMIKKGLHSQ